MSTIGSHSSKIARLTLMARSQTITCTASWKSNGTNMREAAVHEALSRCKFDQEIALLTPVFLRSRGWVVNEASFPVLDVTVSSSRPLRIKLDCQDWDEQPPAALLLEASGQPLAG